MQACGYGAVRPLTEPRPLHLYDPIFIVDEAANLAQLHTVHRDCVRLQLPAENRTGNRAPDLSVKDAVPRDLVGQLVLEPLHIKIAHLCIEVEDAQRIDRAVQHHVHHRRIDVEHLHADNAVIEEVVTVHTGKHRSRIASAIEVDIADRVRIVERSRELDDVVDVARDRLIGRDKCRHILHTRADRVDLEVDAPLARKTDRTVHEPDLTPAALHREIIDADPRERTVRAEKQAVERLIQQVSIRRRNPQIHVGIRHIAMYLPREIRKP